MNTTYELTQNLSFQFPELEELPDRLKPRIVKEGQYTQQKNYLTAALRSYNRVENLTKDYDIDLYNIFFKPHYMEKNCYAFFIHLKNKTQYDNSVPSPSKFQFKIGGLKGREREVSVSYGIHDGKLYLIMVVEYEQSKPQQRGIANSMIRIREI